MWSDNETNSDFIDFQHMVRAVTSIINNDNLLPCSIGVFGDWGSGKSSLMKMIEDKYADEDDVLVINFNGWLFEGYEDTKTVLMSRIVDEIIKKRTLDEKALKIAAKLLRKIDLIKLGRSAIKYGLGYLTMGPAGLAVAGSAEAIQKFSEADYEKYIKEKQSTDDPDESLRTNIQEFHLNFEELINETNIKKVVVFIDDLDRCSHDTVIGTLEAIKLFLFAKNTAFIIGADERLIKYAVRRRFPEIPGDNMEVGRDYLEKLIQYPIRIPPLSDLELTIYVNLLFTNLFVDPGEFEFIREGVLKKKNEEQFGFRLSLDNIADFINEVDEELKEALLLSAQLIPVLTVGLNGNPRQTKRFLNTMFLRHEMAKSTGEELNKRILAKLMLLEYFKSETFRAFYEEQSKNEGLIPWISNVEELLKKDIVGDDEVESLSVEQQAYIQDSWIKDWLSSEPPLAGVNLQPYFYFSRDKLSSSGIKLQRMSSQAQEVFRKLLNDAESVKNVALREAASISPGDASAIFESLSEKIKHDGIQKSDSSPLKRLVDFCEVRKELISQFLGMVEKLPHQSLPISAVTWISTLTSDSEHEQVGDKILGRWSESTANRNLAKIAKRKLKN
ncbi:KAP family P-loop NTPase fold protein [Membranihabitans maritimus]|uniref:KAP family P-loop NTPase fold protein n=1 Tax=Membranihabitans maritimus TaxID=2904244 RepID=UPI001F3D220E|nr:P-loop NTPase fold protein [Membranihabitans maritimus]